MPGIFGNMFDFNHDGRLDALEQGVEFMVLQDMLEDEEGMEDSFNMDEMREGDEDEF
ncbi:MAG: hypothetical protein MJ132_03380 [Clostridia bacterium]|nr:hypothetical protein [Clostridia bacterium]